MIETHPDLDNRQKREQRRMLLTEWLQIHNEGAPSTIAASLGMSTCLVSETAIDHPMTFEVTRRGRYVASIRFHKHIREWQDAGR
jgi:predicted nuclease with RNAse H fold